MPTHLCKIASLQRAADRRRRLKAVYGLLAGLALTPVTAAQAAWTAAVQADPVTRQSRCLIAGDPQTISDGYYTTPVSLLFNDGSLMVITESDLDPSFADLQLAVDDKPPIRSDKIARKTILVFDQNMQELAQLLRSGRQVAVYLRFWPTWPATQSFPVRFNLAGFSKAYDALNQNCRPATPSPNRPAR